MWSAYRWRRPPFHCGFNEFVLKPRSGEDPLAAVTLFGARHQSSQRQPKISVKGAGKETKIVMKRLVLLLAAVVFVSLSVTAQEMKHDQMDHSTKKETTVKGWVSDSECAAHGVKNCSNKEHVADGAKLVIVLDKDGQVYTVTNPETVSEHQGHHVKVNGELDESAKTITVTNLAMLK